MSALRTIPVLPPALEADITIFVELARIHAEGGAVELGYAAEALLRGIRMAVAIAAGPEAAYAMLQRATDEAALAIAVEAP